MTKKNIFYGNIPLTTYSGKYVIYASMVDIIHKYQEGTTAGLFDKIKDLLTEREDYYIVKPRQLTAMGLNWTFQMSAPPQCILLTASGYLKVVDDKEIQGKMFNYYFSGNPQPPDVNIDWKDEINNLLKAIEQLTGKEKLCILSEAYRHISNAYGINLNAEKARYLKYNKSVSNISVLEIVHMLEDRGDIPKDILFLTLSQIKDKEEERHVVSSQ